MNREASDLEAVKPMLQMNVAKRWFQAHGACWSPYKDFYNKHIESGGAGSTKPDGCSQ